MALSSGIRFDESGTSSQLKSAMRKSKEIAAVTEIPYDTETGSVELRDSDFKKKQIFKGWTLAWLAYQSVGVIYGDIGTSPLYVYSSTFSGDPSPDDLLGALSLIIWSLTIIVTLKYVFIVLQADDEGEGGTFAIYSLIARYCNIIKKDPSSKTSLKLERYSTSELRTSNRLVRSFLEKSKIANVSLKLLAVLGVSLIMADGVLTPAQSVLGAIQGLNIVVPDIKSGTIIGATCGILVALFLMQPLGISKLGSAFAPIIILWLLFNAAFGIYNLAFHDYTVLKAFSPYFAGLYMVRNKTDGWFSLGGILLAFTGVEALFADLGAFSKRAIQLSWLAFVFPCLLLAYIGQAAYIMQDPSAWSNPFFNTVPPGMFYPSLVLSILAAIVASQATISACFQLLSQIMTMSYVPHIRTIHLSSTFHGQVYIPIANWILMVGTVVVTAAYSNTTALGHAYGFCVILVTFLTTNMVALVALIVWRVHPIFVFAAWLPLVTFDGLFLTSACTKIPQGAWFTLMIAIVLAAFFILWRYGKETQWAAETQDRISARRLIAQGPPSSAGSGKPKEHLHVQYGGAELETIRGFGLFFDKAGEGMPASLVHFVQKFESRPDVVVLLHVRPVPVPTVSIEDKHSVAAVAGINDCYRVIIRHGYNEVVVTEGLGERVYQQVRRFVIRNSNSFRPDVPGTSDSFMSNLAAQEDRTSGATDEIVLIDGTAPVAFELSAIPSAALRERDDLKTSNRVAVLDKAYGKQTIYIVGKEQLRVMFGKNIDSWKQASWWGEMLGPRAFRRIVLGIFLWVRENSRTKMANMQLPFDKLVEVGFVKEM